MIPAIPKWLVKHTKPQMWSMDLQKLHVPLISLMCFECDSNNTQWLNGVFSSGFPLKSKEGKDLVHSKPTHPQQREAIGGGL